MRWKPGGRSEDVEDVRGEGTGSRFRIGGPQLGIGGFLVVLALSLLFKRDFFSLLGVTDIASPPSATTTTQPMQRGPEDEKQVQFISFVLDDVQKTWSEAFAQANQPYPHAKLVLFSDVASSGCGFAEGASGPFYCPEDHKVYIDLVFFDELKTALRGPGGLRPGLRDRPRGRPPRPEPARHRRQGAAAAGPRTLTAPTSCRSASSCRPTASPASGPTRPTQRDILEQGDLGVGLTAAAAVGDDRIQRQARGRIDPESFTHGTSEQRVAWFRRGLSTGRVDACDTFTSRD